MSIIDRIIKLTQEKGMTGVQLGQLLGLQKSPLTDWKNKKSSPTVAQIKKICEIFGISADYLIMGKEPEPPRLSQSEGEEEILRLIYPLSEKEKLKVAGVIENYLGIHQQHKSTSAVQTENLAEVFKKSSISLPRK